MAAGVFSRRLSGFSCGLQVFSRAAGGPGQLGTSVAHHGGAGGAAVALPSDGEHRPHHHRPAGLRRLQIRRVGAASVCPARSSPLELFQKQLISSCHLQDDHWHRRRPDVREAGLLPLSAVVLRCHLCLHGESQLH